MSPSTVIAEGDFDVTQGNEFDADYGVVSAEQAKDAADANCFAAGWYRFSIARHSKVAEEDKKDRRIFEALEEGGERVDTGRTRPHPFLGFPLVRATMDVWTGGEKPRKLTTEFSTYKAVVEGRVQMAYILAGQLATATGATDLRAALDAGMTATLYGRFSLYNGKNYLNEISGKRPAKLIE